MFRYVPPDPPKSLTDTDHFAMLGSEAALTARYLAYPPPAGQTKWSLPDGSVRSLSLLPDHTGPDQLNVTLVINNVQQEDFGIYHVTVENSEGEIVTVIELKDVKDTSAATKLSPTIVSSFTVSLFWTLF